MYDPEIDEKEASLMVSALPQTWKKSSITAVTLSQTNAARTFEAATIK